MTQQEIRAQALQAAVALKTPHQNTRDVVEQAERLAAWISTGTLPALPAGMME